MPPLSRKELDAKRQEINNLYGKLSEVGSSLKEEKKIYTRLRSDVAAKIDELTRVEGTIVSETESYNWRKSDFISRTEVANEERENRLGDLSKIRDEILVEISDHDLMEQENERLHKRLKVLAAENHRLTAEHREELEIRKQQCFDSRASMEQIFRKTVKEVDHEYKIRANEKMGKEAEWARQENLKLRKEAGKRQEDCANLVEQQKSSYEELVHAKVLLDVTASNTRSQEESSREAVVHMEELRQRIKRMEASKEDLELDIDMLNQKLDRKNRLEKEYRQLEKHLEAAKTITEDIKSKVVVECDKALRKGILAVERENKRKAKQLAKSFQDAIGGNEQEQPGPENQTQMADDITHGSSSNVSVADSDQQELGDLEREMELLLTEKGTANSRDGGPAHSRSMRGLDLDPELVWNSSKSDCYKATVVRQQVRKNRERQARLLQ